METVDFTNSVVVITGAANGIGAGVARRMHASGANLVLGDVDTRAGEAIATELGAQFVPTDVRDPDANRHLVQTALDLHGRLDVVHLNAGISSGTSLGADFDLDAYRRAMAVNLDGVVFGIQAAIDTLLAQNSGQIIVTASMAGLTPVPFDPIYGANKSALVSIVRSLGGAYATTGVRINAMCPSFADTDIIAGIRDHLIETHFPILSLDDVLDAFMAIATDARTGQCWFVVPGRPSEPFGFRNVPGPRGG